MPNDDQAQAAIAALNGTEVDGRNIVVNESRPKPEGGGGGGFKKRSFGNGGGGGGQRWRQRQGGSRKVAAVSTGTVADTATIINS
jgi:RNA recognition motif-containing protein